MITTLIFILSFLNHHFLGTTFFSILILWPIFLFIINGFNYSKHKNFSYFQKFIIIFFLILIIILLLALAYIYIIGGNSESILLLDSLFKE